MAGARDRAADIVAIDFHSHTKLLARRAPGTGRRRRARLASRRRLRRRVHHRPSHLRGRARRRGRTTRQFAGQGTSLLPAHRGGVEGRARERARRRSHVPRHPHRDAPRHRRRRARASRASCPATSRCSSRPSRATLSNDSPPKGPGTPACAPSSSSTARRAGSARRAASARASCTSPTAPTSRSSPAATITAGATPRAAWTLMFLPGWRDATPDAAREAISGRLRDGGRAIDARRRALRREHRGSRRSCSVHRCRS